MSEQRFCKDCHTYIESGAWDVHRSFHFSEDEVLADATQPSLFADTNPSKIARLSDPDSSKIAAAKVAPKTGTHKAKLIDAYRNAFPQGLSDEEACDRAGLPYGGWKRCSDLRRDNFIEPMRDTDGRILMKDGSNGTPVMVCRIKAGE